MKRENVTIKETDLYEPIKELLTAQGFLVKGEVKGCDIAAERDEELWIVEMKLQMNITLLYQAMERLKITNQVFVAVPAPRRARDKNFAAAQRILEKLSLGLIAVTLDGPVKTAEILMFPGGKPRKPNKRAAAVKKEMNGRIGDTAGGATKVKINTAYRERCVRIACLLSVNDALSGRELVKRFNCGKDTSAILRLNYYGWFTPVGGGKCTLSAEGKQYLDDRAGDSAVAYYRMKAAEDIN